MKGVAKLYKKRFPEADRARRQALWHTLCRAFFQRYVPADGHVLDLGAGYCEFINAIQAAQKTAVDLNPDTGECAAAGVTVLQASADKLTAVPDASVDVVFASNFFEHLPTKEVLLACLSEVRRVLRPGGRLIVLQPNIRYAPGAFWDFFDHHLPLSDRSMIEALELSGFSIAEVRPRFLPMTTKSRLPQWPWLVSLYLRLRPVQFLMGKQMLIVAANGIECPHPLGTATRSEISKVPSLPTPSKLSYVRWPLSLLVAAALFATWARGASLGIHYPLGGLDEGMNVYLSSALLKGKILYRDLFTLYPPGYYWFNVLAFLALGESVLSVRIAGLYTQALKPPLTFLFGMTFLAPVYAFAAGCAALSWGERRPQIVLGLVALLCVARWERSSRTWWLALCGILSACSLLYKHEGGGWTLFGCLMLALLCNRRNQRPLAWPRPVAPVLGGFALVVIVVTAYFAAHGALREMADQLGPRALRLIAASSKPYPAWEPFPAADFWRGDRLSPLEGYPALREVTERSYNFYLFPSILVICVPLFAYRWRSRSWTRADDFGLVVWCMSVLSFPAAIKRSDVGHLMLGTPYITLVGAWAAQTLVAMVRGTALGAPRRIAAVAVAVVLLVPPILVPLEQWVPPALARREPLSLPPPGDRNGVRNPPEAENGMIETVGYIREHTAPGEPVFTYQGGNMINFLADRPQPGRFTIVLDSYLTPDDQRAIIRELEAQHVRYIVHWKVAIDLKPFSMIAPILDSYLEYNYRREQTFGLFEIKRLGQASPPAGKRVYGLSLETAGPVQLPGANDIAEAEVRGRELSLRTTGDDGQFTLYSAPLRTGLQPPLKLWVAMSNSVPGTAGQIYWDTGEGFSEGQSASWSLPGDTLMHTYSVSIATSKPVVNLRLDPSRQPDVVSIRRLEVIRAGADRGPSQAQR